MYRKHFTHAFLLLFNKCLRIKNPVFLCEIQILYNLRSKYEKDEFKKDQ